MHIFSLNSTPYWQSMADTKTHMLILCWYGYVWTATFFNFLRWQSASQGLFIYKLNAFRKLFWRSVFRDFVYLSHWGFLYTRFEVCVLPFLFCGNKNTMLTCLVQIPPLCYTLTTLTLFLRYIVVSLWICLIPIISCHLELFSFEWNIKIILHISLDVRAIHYIKNKKHLMHQFLNHISAWDSLSAPGAFNHRAGKELCFKKRKSLSCTYSDASNVIPQGF